VLLGLMYVATGRGLSVQKVVVNGSNDVGMVTFLQCFESLVVIFAWFVHQSRLKLRCWWCKFQTAAGPLSLYRPTPENGGRWLMVAEVLYAHRTVNCGPCTRY